MAFGTSSGKPQFLLNTSTSSLVVMTREEEQTRDGETNDMDGCGND